MAIRLQRDTVSDIRDEAEAFRARWNIEHAGSMQPVVIPWDDMLRWEQDGDLIILSARTDERLIGVLTYLLRQSSRYDDQYKIALHDCTYVEPEHRSGWLPLQLMRFGEEQCRLAGASVIYHSDHVRFSDRSRAFARMGYRPIEVVYEKRLVPLAAGPQRAPSPSAPEGPRAWRQTGGTAPHGKA